MKTTNNLIPKRLPTEKQSAIVRAALRGLAPLAPPERRELLLADLDATDAALHAAEAQELADRAAAVAAAAARVARALRK